MGRVSVVRMCSECKTRYRVLYLGLTTTCPVCGHVQHPKSIAPEDEGRRKAATISKAELDPRFLTSDEFQYMGRSPDGSLRLMVPSRIIEVTPDRLRRLADRLEEMVKSEEAMARP